MWAEEALPEWDRLLSSAARRQRILPSAVLVGGSAAALHAHHRFSRDADHVLTDLRERFDRILGDLDGIETGVRQLIREQPLETTRTECEGQSLTIPTLAEILRIKGVLILKRNATRDYLDFVALADAMDDAGVVAALKNFDTLYPQPNGQSALQQLQVQLAKHLPFDLEGTRLDEYKNLIPRWRDWSTVESVAARIADLILDHLDE